MKIIIDKNGFVDIQNQDKYQGQNSNDYLRLEFEFDEEWNEYNKYLNWKGKDLEEDGCLIENNLFLIPKTISEHQEVEFNVFFKKTVNENTIQTPSEKWTMYFEPSIDANPSQLEKHKDVIDEVVEDVEELQAGKVDKEEGKDLSTNDFTDEYKGQVEDNTQARHTHSNKQVLDNTTASYTTEEKTKLQNVEANAQVNRIEKIKANGTEQTINNKEVNISIPTKTSDLNNDSGFVDNTVNNLINYYLKSETFTKEEVNALIGAITTLNILVVQTLPTQDISTNTIYFVPKNPAETDNIYDEYIYVNNSWELIGTTEVDLTDYVKNTDYATDSNAGIVRLGYGFLLNNDHKLYVNTYTYNNYSSQSNATAISKGTLENVLTNRIGSIETALNNLNTEAEAI